MNYKISGLSKISGITSRALRYYDKVGLLKPKFITDNGYRYYAQEQFLILQQILFFKELGFTLKQIKKILDGKDFDQKEALLKHKEVIQSKIEKYKILIKTIEKTINKLNQNDKRSIPMENSELFYGFDLNKQKEYEQQLIDKYGDKISKEIEESKEKTKNWNKDDWQNKSQKFVEICNKLNRLFSKNINPDSQQVHRVISEHYQWIKQFWTPDRESYSGLGELYKTDEFEKNFSNYRANFTDLLSLAMKAFADKNL